MTDCATESAVQLVHRIQSKLRPSIENILPEIIHKGPYSSEIIEIYGDSNVGKSILLMEFIGQAIIPIDYGGKGASVIIIDLTANFQLSIFPAILEKHILHHKMTTATSADTEDIHTDSGNIEQVIEMALKHLHIYHCFSTRELDQTLMSIDYLLSCEQNISLLAVESLGTFYWNDVSAKNPVRMETYLKNLLKNARKLVDKHRITFVYTRPAFLQSTANEPDNLEKADYEIELKICDDFTFSASVLIDRKCFTRKYSISDLGIKWIYRENTQND